MGRSSLWRCTTSHSQKLPLETTLDLISRTCLSRTLREDMWPLIQRTSQQLEFLTSLLKLLFSITLARFPMDTALSSIATLRILLASLPRSKRRLTVVPVSLLRIIPSLSSLVMLLLFFCPLASQCAWNPSPSSLPLEGSLSVT